LADFCVLFTEFQKKTLNVRFFTFFGFKLLYIVPQINLNWFVGQYKAIRSQKTLKIELLIFSDGILCKEHAKISKKMPIFDKSADWIDNDVL